MAEGEDKTRTVWEAAQEVAARETVPQLQREDSLGLRKEELVVLVEWETAIADREEATMEEQAEVRPETEPREQAQED